MNFTFQQQTLNNILAEASKTELGNQKLEK